MDLIEAGDAGLTRIRSLQDTSRVPLDGARLHAPLSRPTTLRDAYAFETHVKTANANRGREVPEEWYKFPIFYFTNPNNIYGPDDEIPYPPLYFRNWTMSLRLPRSSANRVGSASLRKRRVISLAIRSLMIGRRAIYSARNEGGSWVRQSERLCLDVGSCIVTADELRIDPLAGPGFMIWRCVPV